MKISVLGCSFSSGDELYDEFLIDNYWDFLNEDNYSYNINDVLDWNKKIQEKCKYLGLSLNDYKELNLKLAWPSVLEKKIGYKVDNFSKAASGIDYFQKLYNTNKINLFNPDILIWQLTYEPRYTFSIDNENVLITDIPIMNTLLTDHIKSGLNLKNWKKKIIVDYYENIFNELEYLKEKLYFLEMILYKRILAKKHTIIFSFFETNFHKVNYKPIENEYIHYLNDISSESSGYLKYILHKYNMEDKRMRFGHPDKSINKIIGLEMFEKIKRITNV